MYEEIINKLNTILIELGKNNTTDAELMCTDVLNFLDKTEIIQNGIQRNVELRAFSMLTMGKVQEDQHKHSQAIEYYNTAHDCYEILIDKEGMAKAKGNIGVIYKDLGDLEKALKYQLESLKIFKEINSLKSMGICLLNLGNLYQNLSNYSMALHTFDEALEIYEKLNNKLGIARLYNNIGIVYKQMSNYANSLKYFEKSLLIKEEIEDNSTTAYTLTNIGAVYAEMKDNVKAVTYFTKSLQVDEEFRNTLGMAKNLSNLSSCYLAADDFHTALHFCQQALVQNKEADYLKGQAENLYNIGDIYRKIGEFEEAIKHYNMAKQIDIQIGCKDGLAYDLISIAEVNMNDNYVHSNLDLALESIQCAKTILEEIGMTSALVDVYKNLSVIFQKQSQWQSAYEHYIKYHELEKEVLNEEAKKSAERFHFERTLLEKENEQKLLHQRHEAEQEKVRLELLHKEKELESSINQIVEKNNFLQGISSDIQKFVKSHKTSNPEALERIVELIRKHISHGAVSGMIYDEISSVHGEFINRIKELYPDLTDMEVRISALLRMKLTSANIATLLFISQRTVEVHRLRIRKKLGIGKSDNLYVVLGRL